MEQLVEECCSKSNIDTCLRKIVLSLLSPPSLSLSLSSYPRNGGEQRTQLLRQFSAFWMDMSDDADIGALTDEELLSRNRPLSYHPSNVHPSNNNNRAKFTE